MQEVYRIIIKPYGYDHWDIFTKDKNLFNVISELWHTDEAREAIGDELWEELSDSDFITPPYILLGETGLRQPD